MFLLYKATISGERLQDHWSSVSKLVSVYMWPFLAGGRKLRPGCTFLVISWLILANIFKHVSDFILSTDIHITSCLVII